MLASVTWKLLPAEEIETAPSLLRLAAIQDIESKQSLAYLAPQSRFVTAEPVEGEVGQVGQTQEATQTRQQGRWVLRRF